MQNFSELSLFSKVLPSFVFWGILNAGMEKCSFYLTFVGFLSGCLKLMEKLAQRKQIWNQENQCGHLQSHRLRFWKTRETTCI